MVEKREILLALRKQDSIRAINRNLHVHRTIIRVIMNFAEQKGWLDPSSEMPTDYEIAQIQTGSPSLKKVHPLESYADRIKEWSTDGIRAVVIQRFLKNQYQVNCKIGSLRRFIRKVDPKLPEPVMIRSALPGEVMDVDFGYLGYLWDPIQSKQVKVWVFSGRLRYSRKAFRRLVTKQDVETFLFCHILAFEAFGGVSRIVCLDNLKAGVIKSCIDNDKLNRSYKDLAEYYNFTISPCLPATPQHKGGVENDINYIKKNFWPEIRELLKTNPRLNIDQAADKLWDWDRQVADVRSVYGVGRTPNQMFCCEEKETLQQLPQNRFEITKWLDCIVRREWLIHYNGSRYSVPYQLIEKTVQVRITSQQLKVFFEHKEVASHLLATVKGTYQRNPEHAPPYKEEVLMCNREGLLSMAANIGQQTYKLCEKLFSEKCIDKLRPVRMILKLYEKYGSRLEKACKRALTYNTLQYASIKNILEKELDKEVPRAQVIPLQSVNFKFARNPEDYQIAALSDMEESHG